jgi:large subunit ribosomal protein L15
MELHTLKPAAGSVKKRKRIARGQGSGRGGTSTRGHKGAQSRSGYKRRVNFEGGQMPLQMRLPKRGFKNPNRVPYQVFNLAALEALAEKNGTTEFSVESLYKLGQIKKNDKVKVLGNGELTKGLTLSVNAISESAKSKIEAKGGSVTIVE